MEVNAKQHFPFRFEKKHIDAINKTHDKDLKLPFKKKKTNTENYFIKKKKK